MLYILTPLITSESNQKQLLWGSPQNHKKKTKKISENRFISKHIGKTAENQGKDKQRNENVHYKEMSIRLTVDFSVAHNGSQKNNSFEVLEKILASLQLYARRK